MRIGRKPATMTFSVGPDRFDQLVAAVIAPELRPIVVATLKRVAIDAKPVRVGRSRWYLSENDLGNAGYKRTLTAVVTDLDPKARASLKAAGEKAADIFKYEP